MSRAKKLLKAKRKDKTTAAGTAGTKIANIAKRSGYMATAFGATDFIVANPDRERKEPLIMEKKVKKG